MERATCNRLAHRPLRLTPTGWAQLAKRQQRALPPLTKVKNTRLPGRTVVYIPNPRWWKKLAATNL